MTNDAPPPSPASAALDHLTKAGRLQYMRSARGYRTIVDAAELAASGRIDAATIGEFAELQQAAARRAWDLGETWLAAWADWWRYAGQSKGSNTAAKLAEKQTNSIAQIAQLVGSQLTDLITFQENIEVNYAYWVRQKLDT